MCMAMVSGVVATRVVRRLVTVISAARSAKVLTGLCSVQQKAHQWYLHM